MVIVKSMTRRTASFSQLLKYINEGRKQGDSYCFKNIDSASHKEIVNEYLQNLHFLKKQANSVYLFHQIISLKRQGDLTTERQREILKDLLEQYVNAWASNCLVYAVIHEEEHHIHCHLMISSNEYGSKKNKRLSKSQFEAIKARLNDYAFTKYPQLERVEAKQRVRQARRSKQVDKEVHYKKRTGQPSDREQVRAKLHKIFAEARTSEEFLQLLKAENLSVYQRGNTWGFVDTATGRKYRLKTLELENEFDRVNARISQKNAEKAQERAKTTSHAQTEQGRPAENSPHQNQQEDFTPLQDKEKDEYRRQLEELAERRSRELERSKSKKK